MQFLVLIAATTFNVADVKWRFSLEYRYIYSYFLTCVVFSLMIKVVLLEVYTIFYCHDAVHIHRESIFPEQSRLKYTQEFDFHVIYRNRNMCSRLILRRVRQKMI
jgi:hypothetical protein